MRCPQINVAVVVAADRCCDGTIDRVRQFEPINCDVTTIVGQWRGVGAVRAAAVEHSAVTSETWIANTDADCQVPADWLQRQLAHASNGVDAVAGIVRLEPSDTPPSLLRRFQDDYATGLRAGRHVHAANLGIRGDVYRALGGWFRHSVVGEEHRLWRHATDGQYCAVHDSELIVVTSSRTRSRVIGGFASHLHRLAEFAVDALAPDHATPASATPSRV